MWRRAIKDMPKGSFGVTGKGHTFNTGSCGANGSCIRDFYITYYYAPMSDWMTQKVASSQTVTTVTSNGGSARLSPGRNLYITASTLENNASDILAAANASLVGNVLNNQSWQAGLTTDFYVYAYQGAVATTTLSNMLQDHGDTHVSGPNEKYLDYALTGHDTTTENAQIYRAVIQAGGDLNASFRNNISNTSLTPNAGGIGGTLSAPALNTLSSQDISGSVKKQAQAGTVPLDSPAWQSQLQNALQQISSGAAGGKPDTIKSRGLDTSAYPLPSGSSGYFVIATNPQSPYLITVNPKLSGLGPLDPSVFGDLNALLGIKAASAPVETRATYTDQNAFLGSSYLLGRLNLNPGKDYRFLGDAAFDTRYVSNAILNQTGSRYLNGVGSDLDQMRYLMDNAASAQKSLGLQFGESLSAAQIASLDHSILWWESTTINGQTVMVPKLYLAAQDATVNNGSVIAGNNVNLKAGNITSDGSTVLAANSLALDSDTSISNLNDGLIKAGGGLSLSAVSDINNISATIAGKTVSLESLGGSINNLTRADTTTINAWSKYGNVTLKNTALGNTAGITAEDSLALSAGKDISVTGATLTSGGDMLMQARGDIAVNARQVDNQYTTTGFRGHNDTNNASVTWQGSNVTAGGNLSVQAGHDITLAASDVNAGGSAQLAAANDLNLNSGQTSRNTRNGASETHSTGLDRTTVSAGNNLVLQAGQDINAHSAALAAEQGVGLQAGRDVNLLADKTTQGDSYRTKKKTVINDQVRQQGTEIASGGNTVVIAGRDVNSQAAQVTAKQDVGVTAGRDINLSTALESDYSYFEEIKQKKGFLSKKTTHTITENSQTHEQGTLLSGKNVSLNADNNVLMEGSAIAAEGNVSLKAGNNITVAAATDTSSHYSMKKTRKSGIFGSGLGITIGSQSSTLSRKGSEEKQSDARSVIGTTGGNVIINAGSKATLNAVDVVAARDKNDRSRQTGHIDITASDIAIIPGRDVIQETVKQSTKSSGVGISLSNPIIDTVRNIRDIVNKRGSGITQGQLLAGEAAATAADLGSGTTLPINFGRSSSESESSYYGEFATGSNLNASGNIQLNASGNKGVGNVLIGGSRLGAGEAVIIDAKNNVDIATSTDKETLSTRAGSSNWSITSAAPTPGSVIRTVSGGPNNGAGVLPFSMAKSGSSEDRQTTAQTGSQISGNDIYITSHNGQVNLSGSALSSIDDLLLSAEKGSINVSTGNNSVYDKQKGSQSMVGSLGGDGYSGTVGYSSTKNTSLLDRNQQSTLRSQIASKDGNVSLQAKQDVAVNGADISAGKSLVLKGENILLDTSNDDLHTHNTSSSSQYGVTASASGWAVSAAQALENAARSTEEGRDPRLSAIYAAQSGLNIASQTVQSDMSPAAIKVTVSATAGTSAQTQDYRSQQQQGSHLSAGDSVILNANQDITAHGVDITGKNVVLNAGRDISLQAAQDTDALKNHSNGSQYSLGVGFALIGSQNGFSIEVGASQSKTKENGDSLTNHNTQIQADDALTLNSGRDTLLNGAVLSGDKVVADIGRNLTVSSLQDSEQYRNQSSSSGVNVSICVPPICAGGPVQGTVNVSSGKITNNYQSVVEQSGIFAGKGGFDIQVGNHTQLDGAVIASDAEAAKNRLSTDTLGWSDIHNEAKSGGSQFGLSVSGGVQQNEKSGQYNAIPGSTPSATLAMVSDSATSTTHSAVAPGSIIIRDATGQQ